MNSVRIKGVISLGKSLWSKKQAGNNRFVHGILSSVKSGNIYFAKGAKEKESFYYCVCVRFQICTIYAHANMRTVMLFLFWGLNMCLSFSLFSLEENFFLKTHGRFSSRVYLGRKTRVD